MIDLRDAASVYSCDFCPASESSPAVVAMNGTQFCERCLAKLEAARPLTMTGRVRAADPSTLFRGGGRTLADV